MALIPQNPSPAFLAFIDQVRKQIAALSAVARPQERPFAPITANLKKPNDDE